MLRFLRSIFVPSVHEGVYAITNAEGFEIDPANGGIQTITLSGSWTPKGTNFLEGQSVTLMVSDGANHTLTWTDATWGNSNGVVWLNGSAPTLKTSGYTAIVLFKVGNWVYGIG